MAKIKRNTFAVVLSAFFSTLIITLSTLGLLLIFMLQFYPESTVSQEAHRVFEQVQKTDQVENADVPSGGGVVPYVANFAQESNAKEIDPQEEKENARLEEQRRNEESVGQEDVSIEEDEKDLRSLAGKSKTRRIGESGLNPGTSVSIIQSEKDKKVFYQSCTVSFSLRGASGTPYAVTAGHCGDIGSKVYAQPKRGEVPKQYLGTIRYVSESFYDRQTGDHQGDWALIALDKRATHPPSTDIVPRYLDVSNVDKGTSLCKFGATTGYTCGKKTSSGVSTRISGDFSNRVMTAKQDAASLCALPGDSGAPVFSTSGIVGVLSSINVNPSVQEHGSCKSNKGDSEIYYVPMRELLDEIEDMTDEVLIPLS